MHISPAIKILILCYDYGDFMYHGYELSEEQCPTDTGNQEQEHNSCSAYVIGDNQANDNGTLRIYLQYWMTQAKYPFSEY